MAAGPQAAMLPDGRRLHLNHGPIDLVVEAFGPHDEVRAAYRQAVGRFATILDELVAELPALRRPFVGGRESEAFESPAARRMARAVKPHAETFVTPMAAVAGAVSDEILAALTARRRLDRAYVNNGGDIALWLAPGSEFRTGIVTPTGRPAPLGTARVTHDMPVRGIATSGRGGRSFSFGIADAVTVLAADAAAADVAATLIGNAVDVDHPAIARRPACDLDADSDLGDWLVTVGVGALGAPAIAEALRSGEAAALRMARRGLIAGALLALDGRVRTVGCGFVALRQAGATTAMSA